MYVIVFKRNIKQLNQQNMCSFIVWMFMLDDYVGEFIHSLYLITKIHFISFGSVDHIVLSSLGAILI